MYYLLLLTVFVQTCTAARILGIFPSQYRSHHVVFQPIWHQLAIMGHQITVITPEPLPNNTLPNLNQIDISFTYKYYFEDLSMQQTLNAEGNIIALWPKLFGAMNRLTRSQLNHPGIQTLIKSEDSYDLLIVEIHDPAWFAFAKKYKCPVIGVTSTTGGATSYMRRVMGSVLTPAFAPHVDLRLGTDLNVFERIFSVCTVLVDEVWRYMVMHPIQEQIAQEALNVSFNFAETAKNISILFTNIIPGFSQVPDNLPAVVPLHGLHIKPPAALPNELQIFLDGATEGAIYFSLGSTVQSYLLPPSTLSMFVDVFAKLPYRIIWKLEQQLANLPKNIKVLAWTPQQDILRHKNTKLCIIQGGQHTFEEAIVFRVPSITLPILGDQFHNAKIAKRLKIGTWLTLHTLTGESLKETILETIDNQLYRKNLEELSELQMQPGESLNKATWWIEYVLRHKEAPQLRSPLFNTPLYQQYLLDIALFFTICVAVFVLVVMKCVLTLRKFAWEKIKVE